MFYASSGLVVRIDLHHLVTQLCGTGEVGQVYFKEAAQHGKGAFVLPVVLKQLQVQKQGVESLCCRGRLVFGAKHPGVFKNAAPNHHAIHAIVFHFLVCFGETVYVAIANDGQGGSQLVTQRYRLGNLVPVGCAFGHLFLYASVQNDGIDGLLQQKLHPAPGVDLFKAQACFYAQGQGTGFPGGCDELGRQGLLIDEGRAAAVGYHIFNGAAHVDVDAVENVHFMDDACCLSKFFGFVAPDLGNETHALCFKELFFGRGDF